MATDTTAALRILFGADTRQFDKALIQSTKRLRATGKKMQSIGRGLTVGLTAPLTAIGVSSFRTARDFEFSMQRVAAVSGATETQLQALSAQARELGRTTVFTAADVAGLSGIVRPPRLQHQRDPEGNRRNPRPCPSIRNRPLHRCRRSGCDLACLWIGRQRNRTRHRCDGFQLRQQRTRHVVVPRVHEVRRARGQKCWALN